jgi:hypothetical protein
MRRKVSKSRAATYGTAKIIHQIYYRFRVLHKALAYSWSPHSGYFQFSLTSKSTLSAYITVPSAKSLTLHQEKSDGTWFTTLLAERWVGTGCRHMHSPRSILIGWLVVHTLLYQVSLSKSKISLQIKYWSFGLITKCSIHEKCVTIHTFTWHSPIYNIYNICCVALDLTEIITWITLFFPIAQWILNIL